jgi:hypothetical protein
MNEDKTSNEREGADTVSGRLTLKETGVKMGLSYPKASGQEKRFTKAGPVGWFMAIGDAGQTA